MNFATATYTGATLCRQGKWCGKCHHGQQGVFFMQQKDSPRDEHRFFFPCGTCIWPHADFRWRFISHITRRPIVDVGRSFHTHRCAAEYNCENKMELSIVWLAREKTISYPSHISTWGHWSRVLQSWAQKYWHLTRRYGLPFRAINIGGTVVLHVVSG